LSNLPRGILSEFITQIRKFGSTLYVKIERKVAEELELKEGDFVKVKIWKVKWSIVPKKKEETKSEES